jgi:imidazolonepropionase-like amidohydrolase
VTAHSGRLSGAVEGVAGGVDAIEHGFDLDEATAAEMARRGTFLVSTSALTENWDISSQPKSLQAKAAAVFPKAKESLSNAIEAGVKVALGTDAPAIWHGRNAEELEVLVRRGMTPIQAIRSATTVASELINRPELGQIAPEMLADIIGVYGDPLTDITTSASSFVMKDGTVVADVLGGHHRTSHPALHRQAVDEGTSDPCLDRGGLRAAGARSTGASSSSTPRCGPWSSKQPARR